MNLVDCVVFRMESTALWHTTEIKDRVNGNRRMVQTHNGHVYVLKGKIDEEGMKQYGEFML